MSKLSQALSYLSHVLTGRVRPGSMYSTLPDDVILFGERRYLDIGYWESPETTREQAGEALCRKVAEAAAFSPDDHLLDVGCGYGTQDFFWSRAHGLASITGINITPAQVEHAERERQRLGLGDSIAFHLGDACDLPFGADTFTKIVALECAFHFDTRRDFFREAYRVLKPGGRLVLVDCVPRQPLWRWPLGERAIIMAQCRAAQQPVENLYPAPVYQQHLEQAGFGQVAIESLGPKTYGGFLRHGRRAVAEARRDRRFGWKDIQKARMLLWMVDFLFAGGRMDYILVTADKPAAPVW